MMKIKFFGLLGAIAVLLAVLGSSAGAQSVNIATFDDLASNGFSPFGASFNGGTPAVDQFVQQSEFVSITPVNGGNPAGDGNYFASVSTPGDFSTFNFLLLTARIDAGNVNTAFNIQLLDSNLDLAAFGVFTAPSFGGEFSTVATTLSQAGTGNISNIMFYALGGDGLNGNAFRASFSNLDASVVPEPSALSLAILGSAGLVAFCRRRR